MSLAFLVPVLGRPHRVQPLLGSIAAATSEPYRVVFIADPDDFEEQRAIHETDADLMLVNGGYAAKINAAVRATDEPFVFLGADDLTPQPGWFETATAAMVGGIEVVGVNDLIRRPHRLTHATHFMLTRAAAELPCIDGSRGPLHEGYDHSAVDDELIATASYRGMYAYAAEALVEHRHWMNRAAEDDATYRKGRACFHHDMRLFRRRSHLWGA